MSATAGGSSDGVVVRVPASSANLGPGFDALGMALDLCLDVGLGRSGPVPPTDDGHPAAVAFRRLGGSGPLWCHSPIPMGRGMGFSGAARVGGLLAALVQRDGLAHADLRADEVLALASELEGHADNVAASLHGGVVAVADGRAVRVPLGLDPTVVVWVPSTKTSTDESRTRLPSTVALDDAVFNVGRTALLVAALAAGDVGALRAATQDRLHQDVRFMASPASRQAVSAMVDAGAWCSWLSGSGPSVAALVPDDALDAVSAAVPPGGQLKVLRIHSEGATAR